MTNDECSRQIEFAGEARTFTLNDSNVLAIIAGGMEGMKASFSVAMRFAGKTPLAGQYGDTPSACLKRFIQGEYSVSDIENVIALGLIGGGTPANDAFAMVKEHVTGQPLAANALIASEVISALFVGAEQGEAA